MAALKADGRLQRGEQTRRLVLARAADIASVDGLEGVSIGRLATELEVSKSGVFAHFGSKEELQLATIAFARDVFISHVITPALRGPAGLARLEALCDAWLRYMSEPVFPGGCFFSAMAVEFDARPGRVREAVVDAERDLLHFFEGSIRAAVERGQLSADTDPRQLAFELQAVVRAAGANALLFDDPSVFDLARRAIRDRLAATAPA